MNTFIDRLARAMVPAGLGALLSTLTACSQSPTQPAVSSAAPSSVVVLPPAAGAAVPTATPGAMPGAAPLATVESPSAAVPIAAAAAAAATRDAAASVVPKKVVHKKVHHQPVAPKPEPMQTTAIATPVPTAAPARAPIVVCDNCGVITQIAPRKVDGKGTAIGVLAGGLAGIALGNQIGDGNGKTIAKIAGAAGGALLGNKIEHKARAETLYDIKVRLDNGTETTVTQDSAPTLPIGSDVRVVNGTVIAK